MENGAFCEGWETAPKTLPISPADVAAANTGRGVPAAVYRDRAEREYRMLDSDCILAEKLSASGIETRTPRRVTWIGDVTKEAVPLSVLRDINIFESVMQRHRSFYLKELEFLGANCPGRKYFRYAVVTTERRLAAGEDLARLKAKMQARISRWQRIVWEEWKVETLLNVTEYTFDKPSRTFFVHFNLLIWPHRRLSQLWQRGFRTQQGKRFGETLPPGKIDQWTAYLKFGWHFLKVHWQDNKIVEKFTELIKYVLKGNDGIDEQGNVKSCDPRREMTQAESAWLFSELLRRRFITPYGTLKAQIRDRRLARQKLAYLAAGDGRQALRIVALPEKFEEEDPHANKKELMLDAEEDEPGETWDDENIIRGRTAPLHKASAWAEPGTLVTSWTPNPVTEGGKARLKMILASCASTLEAWQANGAPAPEQALAVSRAWIAAQDDQEAEKIFAFAAAKNDSKVDPKSRGRAPAPSRVHTTDLIRSSRAVQNGAERPINTEPIEKSPVRCRTRVYVVPKAGDGQTKNKIYAYDAETGEILD